MLAADELGEVFRLLLRIRPAPYLVHAKVRMRTVGKADRGRRPRHFRLRHDMLQITEPEPAIFFRHRDAVERSEEHTSELQSLMRISYAVFCLKKKKRTITHIIMTV